MIVRDKIIMFGGTVPSKVAGSLLYTARKKSLQHQEGVTYLKMPVRLEVKIDKLLADTKNLRFLIVVNTLVTKCTFHHRNL